MQGTHLTVHLTNCKYRFLVSLCSLRIPTTCACEVHLNPPFLGWMARLVKLKNLWLDSHLPLLEIMKAPDEIKKTINLKIKSQKKNHMLWMSSLLFPQHKHVMGLNTLLNLFALVDYLSGNGKKQTIFHCHQLWQNHLSCLLTESFNSVKELMVLSRWTQTAPTTLGNDLSTRRVLTDLILVAPPQGKGFCVIFTGKETEAQKSFGPSSGSQN